MKDHHRADRSASVTIDSNNKLIREHLKSDTCEEMTQELVIRVWSVHTIIRNLLGMRKVSARLVPHRLTSDQTKRRLEVAIAKLSRFNKEGENFLSRIVAIDKRSYEPKLQRQSTEWHTPSSPRPAKFPCVQSKLKMHMIFAYDIRCVLTTYNVPAGKTVNG